MRSRGVFPPFPRDSSFQWRLRLKQLLPQPPRPRYSHTIPAAQNDCARNPAKDLSIGSWNTNQSAWCGWNDVILPSEGQLPGMTLTFCQRSAPRQAPRGYNKQEWTGRTTEQASLEFNLLLIKYESHEWVRDDTLEVDF